jgi:hypothetical protein
MCLSHSSSEVEQQPVVAPFKEDEADGQNFMFIRSHPSQEKEEEEESCDDYAGDNHRKSALSSKVLSSRAPSSVEKPSTVP